MKQLKATLLGTEPSSIRDMIHESCNSCYSPEGLPIGGVADEATEEILGRVRAWALRMVGEDEPILPSDEEIGTSAHIEWANLVRREIRSRIEESTK